MRGDGGTAEAADDAEKFGFPPELVAAIAEAGTASTIEVWADNWDIVNAFAAVLTQWRTVPIGTAGVHYIGLDYGAATDGLKNGGTAITPELWQGILTMEREALSCLNAR